MNGSYTVLIPDRLEPPADIEEAVFGDGTTIYTPEATSPEQIPDSLWAEADVVLAWHDLEFERDLLSKLKSCEILVRVGVGFDNVDLKAAGELGIPVCNVPDYGTNDVADHTMSLLLSLWRGIPFYNDRLKDSNAGWTWQSDISMSRLTDSKLAIVGLGRIGTAVARRATAFGMNIIAYDPYVPDGYEKSLGIERVRELNTAIENADVVTFHTPLNDETRGLADEEFFEKLKNDSIVINTARGEIIQLDALYTALRSGSIKAAGLDVLESEPPNPEHPLIAAWRADEEWINGRLQLTPHAAFYCEEALEEMREKSAETAYKYITENHLRNCVNKQYIP